MSDRQSFGELFRGKRTLLITLGIVMFAIAVSAYWMTNKPIAKRRRPEPRARLVEASRVTPATHIVTTDLMGTVIASQSIQLASEVGGRVLSRSDQFIPGGYFRKGERILRIEPRDYQLSVRQSESALVQARSGLKTEMGQQAVAKREYQIMGREVPTADRGLVLRKPQLATAKANVNSASALLDKAKLNLERTLVRSPFNAVVGSRNVDVGAQVGAGSPLASLVGTDQYWV